MAAKSVPPLECKLKYETASSIHNAMTSELHHRERMKSDGYPLLMEQWNENIKPWYEFLSAYLAQHQ